MALGVDTPGRPEWVGAAGEADVESGISVTASHAFHLASITKLLTAVAVLRLIDQGLLALDTRVVDVLERDIVRGIPFIEEITIGQLLDHSSGIYGFNNDLTYLGTVIGPRAAEGRAWDPRELVALAHGERVAPFGEPGSGHYYGDTNYILLGLVIESVTGRKFREHMRAELFEPSGMRCTEFVTALRAGTAELACPAVEGYARLSEKLATYWQVPDSVFPVVPGTSLRRTTAAGEALDAAAGIMTTVPDLMAFARALLRGNLLADSTRRWLLAPGADLASKPVGTERIGAMRAYRLPVGPVLTAEGDGPGGSNNLLAWHPETQTIVVAFTNIFGLGTEHEFLLEEVAGRIFEHLSHDTP